MERGASVATLRERLPSLPLPLAQLARRVLHSKSPTERHTFAISLGEATLGLAVAARLGLYIARGFDPRRLPREAVDALSFPSSATQLALLKGVNDALEARPDAALLPLARDVAEWRRPRATDWPAAARFAAHAGETKMEDLTGFFSLLASHGARDRSRDDEEMGALLVAALAEILGEPALFGGLRLARPTFALDDSGEARPLWEELTGLSGIPLGTSAAAARPGRLYFTAPGVTIPLDPLVALRVDVFGREQVGFLAGTVRRTRRARDGVVEERRRLAYLDFVSGELFGDGEAIEGVGLLLAELGRQGAPTEVGHESLDFTPPAGIPVFAESTIIGDFELLGELGRGGMGVVYRARQLSLRREVALKVLPPGDAADDIVLERFKREYTALERCDHPNVVKVLTAGNDGDRHYYAMELVEGADLRHAFSVLAAWKKNGATLRDGHLRAALLARPSDEAPTAAGGRPLALRLCELFADAAAALTHLHDVGVIHRDIKPGNLMLTPAADRIVLMDLGVARLEDQSRALTAATDRWMGTLGYLPPEQLADTRGAAGPRADVYSLGASLYELCTLRRLFEADSEERMIHQILRAEPLPPHRAAPELPPNLATVIQVAISKDPTHRYATAQALEDDLRAVTEGRPIKARAPGLARRAAQWARQHRTLTATLAIVAVVVAGNFGAIAILDQQRGKMCRGAEARLTGVWDAPRRAAVEQAFTATGKPYAAGSFGAVASALDAYARDFTAQHTDACAATHLRGEQSERAFDLRMACLDDRRRDLAALTDVLTRADGAVVDRALSAALDLPAIAPCRDVAALGARRPPPAEARGGVEAARSDLAAARALDAAGKYGDALSRARAVTDRARAIGWLPLLAEALFVRGGIEEHLAQYEDGVRTLEEGWNAAEAGGDDALKAHIAIQLVYALGTERRLPDAALRWADVAESTLSRIGGDDDLVTRWNNHVGALRRMQGDYDKAQAHFERALEINMRLLGPEDGRVADTLNNLGNVLDDKGAYDAALARLEQSLAIRRKLVGNEHPDLVGVLNNLAIVQQHRGKNEEALAAYREALRVGEKVLGPDHPSVAMALNNIASVLSSAGDHLASLEYHRRALAIWEATLGPDHPNVGIVVNNMGEDLRHLAQYDAAMVDYRRALSIFEKRVGLDHPVAAMVLCNIGLVHVARNELEAARGVLEKALAICAAKTCEPDVLAESRFAMARALGRGASRARELAEQARAGFAATPGLEDKAREVDAFMAAK